MSGKNYNIFIEKNTDFTLVITLDTDEGVDDWTGYTANAAIRKHYYSASIAATFNVIVSIDTLILDISANNTANLAPNKYVYDIKMTGPGGEIIRPVKGLIYLQPSVT
jgi:hypothetical protein